MKNHLNILPKLASFDLKCSKMRWRLGLRPRPRWGSLRRSPRPPNRKRQRAFGARHSLFRVHFYISIPLSGPPLRNSWIRHCIYTYMYAHMHTYIHTYMHIHIDACTHVYTHTIHTCKHTYIYSCINIHLNTVIYIDIFWHNYVYVCMLVYVCMHMYACICMYVYVCMYMYVCICMCVCMCVYVCVYVCMYVCVCMHICICMYEQYIGGIVREEMSYSKCEGELSEGNCPEGIVLHPLLHRYCNSASSEQPTTQYTLVRQPL